jgi:hypothetical protein
MNTDQKQTTRLFNAWARGTGVTVLGWGLALSAIGQSKPAAHNHGHGHAHGVAHLQLVWDGQRLRGELEVPMESLLGHEYLPRSTAQKNAMAQLQQGLADPAYVMVPTPAAQCVAAEVKASSTMFEGRDTGGHSSLLYQFAFQCAQPQALRDADLALMRKHPRLKEVAVEMALPTGQRAVRVKAAQPRLVW